MRSRTYAFMPWITATTATRNPTDTMIPSSVKNERSLWLHAVWRAWRMASERGMGLQNSGMRDAWVRGRIPHPPSRIPLFVPQRLDRIEPRRLVRGVQAEHDPRERGGHEGGDHRAERHVRRDRREMGDREGDEAAHQHSHGAAHEGQGRGLDQELPQDFAAGRAQGLADADLPGALRAGDRHDRD